MSDVDRKFFEEFALREPDYKSMYRAAAEMGRKFAEAQWRSVFAALDALDAKENTANNEASRRTGNAQEPVAFGAEYDGKIEFATDDRRHCEDWVSSQCRREYMNIVPLYRKPQVPQPILTHEERVALESFSSMFKDTQGGCTLRRLLNRLDFGGTTQAQ